MHATSPCLLERKRDATKLPQMAGAEWREGKVVYYKHRHACFGKLILLPVLHMGLFVSRLLSVADVFDALSASRVYKQGWTLNQTYNEICMGSGTQFDPKAVELFKDHFDQFCAVFNEIPDEPVKDIEWIRTNSEAKIHADAGVSVYEDDADLNDGLNGMDPILRAQAAEVERGMHHEDSGEAKEKHKKKKDSKKSKLEPEEIANPTANA